MLFWCYEFHIFGTKSMSKNSEKGNWVLDVLHMVLQNEFLLNQVC